MSVGLQAHASTRRPDLCDGLNLLLSREYSRLAAPRCADAAATAAAARVVSLTQITFLITLQQQQQRTIIL